MSLQSILVIRVTYISISYLLHLELSLKSIYPWKLIIWDLDNGIFRYNFPICKCLRILLLPWLHTYSILIHDGCHVWTRGYWSVSVHVLSFPLCLSLWGPIFCFLCFILTLIWYHISPWSCNFVPLNKDCRSKCKSTYGNPSPFCNINYNISVQGHSIYYSFYLSII